MKRSVMVWSCRVGLLTVVASAFAGACGKAQEDCAERGNCGPFNPPIKAGDEFCTDGMDNDGDGKADCHDSDCASLIVCNAPKDGWTYTSLNVAPHDANAAGQKCFDGTNAVRLFDGHTGQPTCEECTCAKIDLQSPLTCNGYPELECTDALKGDQTTWIPIDTNDDGLCQKPPGLANMIYCRGTLVNISEGSCTPKGGNLIDAPAWARDAFSCPIALDARVDEAGTCLRHDGELPCPNGWNGTRTVVYKSEQGARACTPCACTGQCFSRILVYDGDGCQGGAQAKYVVLDEPSDVGNLVTEINGDNRYSIVKYAPDPPPNECIASGGEPAGVVNPNKPVTVCCK